jgi:hypothetical protein
MSNHIRPFLLSHLGTLPLTRRTFSDRNFFSVSLSTLWDKARFDRAAK